MANHSQVIGALEKAMQTRDPALAAHSAAVAELAVEIATVAGLGGADIELVQTAAMLHDIGRLALPDWSQLAGFKLDDADWFTIWAHPDVGADLLEALGTEPTVVEAVRAHHERLDGRGYPRQLETEEIPDMARIIAVAEAFDALVASDGYRTPVSSFAALRELRRVAGTQLDRECVEGLAAVLGSRSGRHDRDRTTAALRHRCEVDGRSVSPVNGVAELRQEVVGRREEVEPVRAVVHRHDPARVQPLNDRVRLVSVGGQAATHR
jgi:putative nucleotidyltransferase with HDIG domain